MSDGRLGIYLAGDIWVCGIVICRAIICSEQQSVVQLLIKTFDGTVAVVNRILNLIFTIPPGKISIFTPKILAVILQIIGSSVGGMTFRILDIDLAENICRPKLCKIRTVLGSYFKVIIIVSVIGITSCDTGSASTSPQSETLFSNSYIE